jgi:hypothetical protein
MGENFFNGNVHARGSLSAYYHSPMRDVFVGSLCVVGVLLLTYLAGQWNTLDYIFSTVAVIHGVCAALFIAGLFVICLALGYRETKERNKPGWARVHYACAGVMAAAVAWLIIGNVLNKDIFGLEPLWVCEVLSVWAFGVSWFLKGDALRLLVGRPPAP